MIRSSEIDITTTRGRQDSTKAELSDIPFSSNALRLSAREWIVAGVILFILSFLIPSIWEQQEHFVPKADYRVPYKNSNDYWQYRRYSRWAAAEYDAVVLGDSVIWGHYVPARNTLAHYLNELDGRERFANLGIDGIHPVALAGLIQYYAKDITGKSVILHFNPLWMTSAKHDLQTEKEFHFNHPRLVPQFYPNIPCYAESPSNKISIILERKVPFFSWTSHLQQTHFANLDPATWALEHPYELPFRIETGKVPVSDEDATYEQTSWIERGLTQQDFPWVTPESSLQWRFFRRAVQLLHKRDNTVFVLVGPFNEHMMKEASRNTYRNMKKEFKTWFQENNIDYFIPAPLLSDHYADASHPLSRGYALWARQLYEDKSFRFFLSTTR